MDLALSFWCREVLLLLTLCFIYFGLISSASVSFWEITAVKLSTCEGHGWGKVDWEFRKQASKTNPFGKTKHPINKIIITTIIESWRRLEHIWATVTGYALFCICMLIHLLLLVMATTCGIIHPVSWMLWPWVNQESPWVSNVITRSHHRRTDFGYHWRLWTFR